jgi:hypothetical protein
MHSELAPDWASSNLLYCRVSLCEFRTSSEPEIDNIMSFSLIPQGGDIDNLQINFDLKDPRFTH